MPIPFGKLRLWLDGDARPAQFLFEIVGVAVGLMMIGADVHEYAIAAVTEEILENPFLNATRIRGLAVLLFEGRAFTCVGSGNGDQRITDLPGQPETTNDPAVPPAISTPIAMSATSMLLNEPRFFMGPRPI